MIIIQPISIDYGRVRPEIMVRGTEKYMAVELARRIDFVRIAHDLPKVDNITLVCAKHVDDKNYIFKLSLLDDDGEETGDVSITEHLKKIIYTFHITPELTRNLEPGNYQYGISFIMNGDKKEFSANVLKIEESITDTSGGKIISSDADVYGENYIF